MGSIKNEIERLETAKSDIETAIENCGVNVPDNELISTYASYIRQIPSAVFSSLNADLTGGADAYIESIEQSNGIIETTVGGLVSTSKSGLVPKADMYVGTIDSSTADYVLTRKGTVVDWHRLPANAFKNDNTTYTLAPTENTANTFTVTPSSGNAYNVTITPAVKVDGVLGATITRFCSCTTAQATSAKVVSITSGTFSLESGARLLVNFANTNTASTPTLNVNGTGAKYIYYNGATLSSATTKGLLSGLVDLVYDGSKWNIAGLSPHLHDGSEVTKLTGYSKASTSAAIAATDSLNAALGKLEYKADLGKSAYDLVAAAYDGDGTIENLTEVLRVLQGLSDTVTLNSIIGQYLLKEDISPSVGVNGSTINITVGGVSSDYVSIPAAVPTALEWETGTTSGPVGVLSGTGMSDVVFPAIPSASGSNSGIVTISTQTFAGSKTFNADTYISSSKKLYFNYSSTYTTNSNYVYGYSTTYLALNGYSGMYFRVGGTNELTLSSSAFSPSTNGGLDLGTTTYRFGNIYSQALYTYPRTYSGTLYLTGFSSSPSSTSTTNAQLYASYYAQIRNSNTSTTAAIYAPGGFYESSDERLKDILKPVKIDLDDLSKIRKVYYTWKNSECKERQLGIIAQDVQKLYPELVDVDPETGYLSLAYDKVTTIALGAVDVLYELVKDLKEENLELKSRLGKLENLL